MQFLISVIDASTGRATAAEIAAVDVFNDRLRAEGHWVFAGGLASPNDSVVVEGRATPPMVTGGALHPPVEGEYLSGCWIVTAPDLETVLLLAAEGSRCCNRKVEVRPFL